MTLTRWDPAAQPSSHHDSCQDFEGNLIEEGELDMHRCTTGLREHQQNSTFLPRTPKSYDSDNAQPVSSALARARACLFSFSRRKLCLLY